MKDTHDVVVLVGSLRKESFTRKLVLNLVRLAPASLKLDLVAIGDLPFYNEDLERGDTPKAWEDFRERVRAADAVLFATPEYNRSVPGVLKNAIDVGSRPYGQSVWDGKPAAVISVSPGAIGAFGANHHLRQMLVFLNMPAMQQPEAYVGNIKNLLGPDNAIQNESTTRFLINFMQSFGEWIERTSTLASSGR